MFLCHQNITAFNDEFFRRPQGSGTVASLLEQDAAVFACYFPSWKSLCQLAPFPFSDLFLFCFPPLEGFPCHSHRAVPFSFQWHCTIAAPRRNARPCRGVLALCSWTLLTVSISRGPSPEKISGSSWTFPLPRNPHVVVDKHEIWNRAGGRGFRAFSCHPHHCVEPVVSSVWHFSEAPHLTSVQLRTAARSCLVADEATVWCGGSSVPSNRGTFVARSQGSAACIRRSCTQRTPTLLFTRVCLCHLLLNLTLRLL